MTKATPKATPGKKNEFIFHPAFAIRISQLSRSHVHRSVQCTYQTYWSQNLLKPTAMKTQDTSRCRSRHDKSPVSVQNKQTLVISRCCYARGDL